MDDEGFERSVGRVRRAGGAGRRDPVRGADGGGAADFAARGVAVAVVEAGLGGRLDATNVLDARVVLLTNVSLEHTDVLGDTREAIAREKLAVAGPEAIVVLGEPEWESIVAANDVRIGGAREAAEAFLGRAIHADVDVTLPGASSVVGRTRSGTARTPLKGSIGCSHGSRGGAGWSSARCSPTRTSRRCSSG